MKLLKIFFLIFIFFIQFSYAGPVDSLINFQLKDQFGKNYSNEDFQNTTIVLIGSDKEGSQYNEEWITAIVDSLGYKLDWTNLVFIGVADLRGVPFFLKPFVPGFFPDEKEKWILMDWDGEFAQAYNFREDFCNILIFNKVFKVS